MALLNIGMFHIVLPLQLHRCIKITGIESLRSKYRTDGGGATAAPSPNQHHFAVIALHVNIAWTSRQHLLVGIVLALLASPRQQHCHTILCNLLKFFTVTSSFENPLLIAPPVDHCLVSHSACLIVMLNRYKKVMLIQSIVFATLFRNSQLCSEILSEY